LLPSFLQVLGLVKYAKASGIPFGKKETFVDTPELRSLLRKAAQNAIVLLKNEQSVLPIQKGVKKIAVIGSNARVAVTSGGGSASLLSSYTVTPLEGIQTAAKELGAKVEFAVGSSSYLYLPPATKLCSLPEGTKGGERDVGFLEFWLGEPPAVWDEEKAGIQAESEPAYTTPANSMNAFFMDGLPQHISEGSPYIRVSNQLRHSPSPFRTGNSHCIDRTVHFHFHS
jgi:beta-glucosidase